jgi:hypothetical protein
MAPEVLSATTITTTTTTNSKSSNPNNPSTHIGYGLAVDYWSIGCILFECLAGFPPFTAATTDEVWVNVYHWPKVLERPIYTGDDEEFNFTDRAWDLITRLITFPETRMQDIKEVQRHPFFKGWYAFEDLRVGGEHGGPEPPFVPMLKGEKDTSYFDDFEDPKDMAMYQEVRDRQAMLEAKTREAETGGGGGGNGGWVGKGGKGGHGAVGTPVKDEDGLRSAFVGFTFKHHQKFSGEFLQLVFFFCCFFFCNHCQHLKVANFCIFHFDSQSRYKHYTGATMF